MNATHLTTLTGVTELAEHGARLPRRYRPAPLPPAAPPATHPLTGQHVLVVGIHYAPGPAGTGPFTEALAEQLAGRAASVTVIAGMPHDPAGADPASTVDPRYRGHRRLMQSPANGAGPLVVRLGHHVPRRWTPLARARYETSFAAQALLTRLPYRPDLVVGITPAPGGAAAAARIARRHDAALLVVARHVVARHAGTRHAAAQDGGPQGGEATGLAALPDRLERYALTRADRIGVTSLALGPAVTALGVPDERIGLLPGHFGAGPTDAGPTDAGAAPGSLLERLLEGALQRAASGARPVPGGR